MSNNNFLTTIANSFTIEADVVSALPGIRADAMSPVLYCTWENSSFIPERGVFCVSSKSKKTLYGSTTNSRQQKTSLGKLVNKKVIRKVQTKSIKQIISNFLDLVKEKFAVPNFGPKRRDFTNKDLELIKHLVSENKLDFQKAWAEFYKLTGTNKNTFNS